LISLFNGNDQQDDRDIRAERAKQKVRNLQNVMLRARFNRGGIITAPQWLAIDKFRPRNTLCMAVFV